jgi:FkbM family methyltransferase
MTWIPNFFAEQYRGVFNMLKSIMKQILPQKTYEWLRGYYRQARLVRRPRVKSRLSTSPEKVLNCCIAYNEYGAYCVPLSPIHRPAVQTILAGKVHEPETILLIRGTAPDQDVVHAGTFFGDFLPGIANSRISGAKIYAFEPNPVNYKCAQITCLVNSVTNVELLNLGLGEAQGSAQMITHNQDGKERGGSSRILHSPAETESLTETVQIVRIDDIVPSDRKVGVIQLDVEGYEKPALLGALQTIKRCLPVIVLETLPEKQWMEQRLEPLGYSVVDEVHGNYVLSCQNSRKQG